MGSEAQEKKLNVVEMRMLRWMCGVTKLARNIYRDNKMDEMSKKNEESMLKRYGHV